MRIKLFAKTLLAVLLCSSALAGSDPDRSLSNDHRYAVSVDPLGWVYGVLGFQLEASLNDRMSFNMPFAVSFKKLLFNNTSYQGTYFAPKFGVKYYVTGKAAHQGFYVNPLLGLFVGKLAADGSTTDAGLTYGFRFGYAWNIWNGLWLDSYVGYEDTAASFTSVAGNTDNAKPLPPNNNGLNMWDAGMMLGYVW